MYNDKPQEGGGLNFPPESGGIEGGVKTAKGRYYSGYKGVCLSSYKRIIISEIRVNS